MVAEPVGMNASGDAQGFDVFEKRQAEVRAKTLGFFFIKA